MPAASNTPTPERRARGPLAPPRVDRAHFRQCWAAVDPLDRMLAAGLITLRQRRAAIAFRATWDAAFRGSVKVQDWNAVRPGRQCGKSAPMMTERQADSLARLKQIRDRLDAALYLLLEWCLIEELRWSTIGNRLAIDHRTARSWCAAAISALAALPAI
jgi:hypothetical protein